MNKPIGMRERETLQNLINAQHQMLTTSFEQVSRAQDERNSWNSLWCERVDKCEEICALIELILEDQAQRPHSTLLPRHRDALNQYVHDVRS